MIELTIQERGATHTVRVADSITLQDALQQSGHYAPFPCGGNGRCGRCRMHLLQGAPEPTPADLRLLSEQELAAGWRLACQARLTTAATIRLGKEEADFQVQVATPAPSFAPAGGELGIAIDLGTTTLAMELVELATGQVRATWVGVNHQRAFGADVLSRIQAAVSGQADALRETVSHDLADGIRALLRRALTPAKAVVRLAIAANTTMQHLLLGYDCRGLGVEPFTPVDLAMKTIPARQLLGDDRVPDCPATLIPGASAFIGGDIIAGLLACDIDTATAPTLLVDLGTNGEMVLANGDSLWAASAAAGPAFEGGQLSCGCGSIPGAITRVQLRGAVPECQTIGNQPPVGVCGTGALEAVYALRRAGLLDSTGLLREDWQESGFPLAAGVVLTQADIRELQLAKAAVRAGLELLLEHSGLTPNQMDTAWLAGGFGTQLHPGRAADIGLLPPGLATQPAGNTALIGARKLLTEPTASARVAALAARVTERPLAADPAFHEQFVGAMNFP